MGLKRWDQPNDIFSYIELSDNFALLDNHDHTSGKGVQVPTGGIANLAVTDTKIANDAVTTNKILNDAVTTAKIGTGQVSLGKLAADSVDSSKIVNASVADGDLASPNNGVYRTIAQTSNLFVALGANTYVMNATGSTPSTAGSSQAIAPLIIPWNTTHYAVAGKSTVLRLAVMGSTNSIASTSTFAWGIYPVSASAGAASQLTTTLGALGSVTAGYTTPAASTVLTPQYTTDFTLATGVYVIGCVITGAMAATSVLNVNTFLQIRHV